MNYRNDACWRRQEHDIVKESRTKSVKLDEAGCRTDLRKPATSFALCGLTLGLRLDLNGFVVHRALLNFVI